MADASVKFRDAFALAERWRMDTEGAFTPHRPDGSIDLAGVIKAQAIQESGEALRWHGATAWCLNAGGDVLTVGVQADGRPWVVGIVDPADRQALLSQFTCSSRHPAVATSGVAERGEQGVVGAAQGTQPLAQRRVRQESGEGSPCTSSNRMKQSGNE